MRHVDMVETRHNAVLLVEKSTFREVEPVSCYAKLLSATRENAAAHITSVEDSLMWDLADWVQLFHLSSIQKLHTRGSLVSLDVIGAFQDISPSPTHWVALKVGARMKRHVCG